MIPGSPSPSLLFYGRIILLLLFFYMFLPDKTLAQNASFYHRFKSSDECEAYLEKFGGKLDSCKVLQTVLKKFNATRQDSSVFANFYEDTLYNDRVDFFYGVASSINTNADVQQYASGLIQKYIELYQKLEEIKKNYPSTIQEYGVKHPHKVTGTCNPTCSDIGFESGTLTGWDAYYAGNNSTATTMTYAGAVGGAAGAVTKAAYDIVTNKYHTADDYQVAIMSGAGNDPIAGPTIPVVAPGGGSYSCRLGDTSVGGSRVGIIDQVFTVTAGNTALNYMYAVLIDKAPSGHTFGQQPHFIVTITDQATGDTLQCGQYIVTSSMATTGYTTAYYKIPAYGWYDSIYCAPWKSVYVSLQNYVGHCIEIQAIVSDCYPTAIGPHFCYVYFDATCGPHSIIASTPSVCGGPVNLTAPTGGTYAWAGPCISGSTTAQTVTVTCSGTYTVTVTSPDGCSDTLQKVVTVTPTMSVTPSSTNGACSTKGSATATPTGGTPPYTYAWSNGVTTQKDTGLTPGTYSCVVSASGCKDTLKYTITGGGSISATIAPTNPKCSSGTGSATATPSGGTAPYTYSWNTGSTSQTLTGVAAGTYTCTIKDAGGCITTQTVTITVPAAITTSTSSTGTLCGASTGSATVTAGGGTPGYTYSWNTGQSTSSINNLAGGSYNVIVTDANGCSANTSVTIPSTNGPSDSIVNSTNVLCFGGNNGSAQVGAAGGNPPYTYAWTGGQTNTTAIGLTAGNYTVTVKDTKGCIATASVVITQPTILRDSIVSSTNIICFGGNNGSATAGFKGGTPGYTYSWNSTPVQTTANLTGVTAGTYTLSVIDANGCKDSTKVTITQPTPLTLLSATSPATCSYLCNGQATVTPTTGSGTPPYSWSWSNGGTSANINNMCVNSSYTCTVTDAHGCTHDTVVSIANPPPIVLTLSSVPELCGKKNGSATVSATGGTPGYTYLWNNGGTGTTINNLDSSNYCVIVTDINKCKDTNCVRVGEISGDSIKIVSVTNELCNGGNNGNAVAAVSSGIAPFTYSWSPVGGNTLTASSLTAGLYTVTLTDSSGCQSKAVATITQPPPVTVTAPPDTICIGQTYTITATAGGGTPAYTYMWNSTTSGVSYTVNPVITTTYSVQATDANGCTSPVEPVTVYVRKPLVVITSPPKGVCPGNSVILTASGSGGDGIYDYTWSPAAGLNATTGVSVTATPTVTTTYTVVIHDACGTPQAQDSVPVTVYPLPKVDLVAIHYKVAHHCA